ncbi:MAG: DHH family phosphoesterase [Candidatus Woesearchaeota archaeon]
MDNNTLNSLNKYDSFMQEVKRIANVFKNTETKKAIRVVSHLDSDGICACAIMINCLTKRNLKYSISILPQLKAEYIKEFEKEDTEVVVFTDFGSGQIKDIEKFLKKKIVFVLDHHIPQADNAHDNIYHLNPCLFNIDGSSEISGAGMTFLFANEVFSCSDMAHIAIIGAIADMQEDDGFKYLNNEILKIAEKQKKIIVNKGLKFFGLQTRPIPKLLAYGTETFIPGVTGNESSAIQFLQNLGINPMIKGRYKLLNDLTIEEKKKLIAGIILSRHKQEKPDNIFTKVYILSDEEENSPLRDAREFSTLLNACGRLNKASLGIATCLGDQRMKKKAIGVLQDYKREILNSIRWYNENKENNKNIIKKENFIIINAEDNVIHTMIGTLASIIARSNEFKDGYYILALAQSYDGTTKVSLRISGNSNSYYDTDIGNSDIKKSHESDNNNYNLKEIISKILKRINHGEGGGHLNAAGAIIDTDKEEEFIEAAKIILDMAGREESV